MFPLRCQAPQRRRDRDEAVTRELVLASETANRVLAAARRGLLSVEPMNTHVIAPETCAHTAEDVRQTDLSPILCVGALDDEPLHIFVTDRRLRAPSRGIVRHLMNPELPEGSLLRVAPGIVCPSWERHLVRSCAEARSLSERIMLGMELCGTYAHQSLGHRELPIESNINRVSSRTAVQAYLERAGGTRGVKRTREAMRWVLDNANSPCEAALGGIQHLPPRLGGLGYPSPTLNERLEVPRSKRLLTRSDHYLPDIFWLAFLLDLEYDSDEWHLAPRRVRRDKGRLNDIQALGVRVMPVTSAMLNHFDGFELLERQIGEHMARTLGEPMIRHLRMLRDEKYVTLRRQRLYELLPPYQIA